MKMKWKVMALAALCAACTPQEVKTAENAVFTAEQVACIVMNSGLIPLSPSASGEIATTCNLAPSLTPYVQQFITNILSHPGAAEKLRASGLGAPKS